MDFLDPKYKRSYHYRLLLGYALTSIAIILGTIILVYGAYGYGINTKNGQIVQNGLLFVDSQPSGASITLNAQTQSSKTGARLILPSGNYSMTLSKAGYRDWKHDFALDEQTIRRYPYAFLFPDQPLSTVIKEYPATSYITTQSPDLSRLMVGPVSNLPSVGFEEFDLNDLTKQPVNLTFPSDIFSTNEGFFSVVDWANDNNHLIIKHDFSGGNEFVIFNRDKPSQSVNINKQFSINPESVAWRNGKADQLYFYNSTTKELNLINLSGLKIESQSIKKVLAYTPVTNNLVLYVTESSRAGLSDIKVTDGNQTYTIETMTARDSYVIDASEYQGHWYYLLSSSTDGLYYVYQDPINSIKDPAISKAQPVTTLNIMGLKKASFAANGRNIMLSNNKDFVSYDLENKQKYKFSLDKELQGAYYWMDNYHILGNQADNIMIIDFDGLNQQLMGATVINQGGFFSKDYKHLLTFRATGDGHYDLVNLDLRAGTDLPKSSN